MPEEHPSSEDGIRRYAQKIRSLPTVMRMEIDFTRGRWFVTVRDERWSLSIGVNHNSLYGALKQMYEGLVAGR